jgi:hypothetical protein
MKIIKAISLLATLITFNKNSFSQNSRLWGTYYGGSGSDVLYGTVVDPNGNIYICGETTSTNNISSGGFQNTFGGGSGDGFLIKFAPNGTRLWGTYIGGSGSEAAWSVACDANGNVYVAGQTSSGGMSSGGFQNAYGGGSADGLLVKYDANGNRLWATYYGGSSADYCLSVAVDAFSGNVYVVGYCTSTASIATVGAHQTVLSGGIDCFLVKFTPSGSRVWGTYCGGPALDQPMYGAGGVSTDAFGNVCVSGETQSTSGLATAGGFQNTIGGGMDGFIVKFNSAGVRQWGTYYGQSGDDYGYGSAMDSQGNVYHCGLAPATSTGLASGGFQNTQAGSWDSYIVKFGPTGNRIWATYYGGSSAEYAADVEVDNLDNIYVVGAASSTNNVYYNGFQSAPGGIFVAKFDANCNRICATNYNGQNQPTAIGVDLNSQNIYLGGRTTADPMVLQSGFQMVYGGGSTDAMLVKFTSPCTVPSQPGSISGSVTLCGGGGSTNYSVAPVVGATSYTWSLPGGWSGTSTTNIISATPGTSGIFSITASNACGTSSTQTLSVTVNAAPVISVNSGSICSGQSFTMTPSGANTYTYQGGSAVVSPITNTSYTVVGTSTAGCVSSSPATSNVTVDPTPTISVAGGAICPGGSFTLNPGGANTYSYSGGQIVSPTVTTSYTVTGTSTAGCVSADAVVTITVANNLTVTISGNNTVCAGSPINLTAGGAATYTWNTGAMTTTIAPTPTTNATYSVIGASGSCTNTALQSITVNALPSLTMSTTNAAGLCIGQTATLGVNGANTYTWNTGANGGTITVTPTVTTTYSVTGTNSLGCSNSATLSQIAVDCTGMNELNSENSFIIYPNPNSGILNIDISTSLNATEMLDGKIKLQIFNVLGELVFDGKITAQYSRFNIQHLDSGIFLIKIGAESKKIIIN